MKNKSHLFSKKKLHDIIEKDDAVLKEYLNKFHYAADIIEIIREININHWPRILKLIEDKDMHAQVINGLDRGEWNELMPYLNAQEIADIIRQLDTDDAADLLADVPLPARFETLKLLTQKERTQVQQLLRYPEDSAGGIMQLELALVNEDSTVKEAIKIVRDLVEEDVEVFSAFVVDKYNRLVGNVALVDLLLNKETTKVSKIMDPDALAVKPLLDQEEVASIFKKYDLISVPVVDDKRRILGQILIDDVVDVLAEEAEEDALHMAGTTTEELLHASDVIKTARIRLPWLGIALVCSLGSGFLLHYFESTVQQAVIILSFIPVITAMGGNVGTQSATLIVRGFATGKVSMGDVKGFLYKELRVGMVVGCIYGLCAGLVGTFVLTKGNFYLGIVVFFAMACGMTTASMLGVIAPSALKKLNIDPAIASGPFVTTMNDISGIVIYMTIANLFLAKLT